MAERLLAPWVFVLTGILFNVLAAVITHYFIGLNNDEIMALDREISRKQVLIDAQWQARIEAERKQEFFILLLATESGVGDRLQQYFDDYLAELAKNHALEQFENRMPKMSADSLERLLEIGEAVQREIIDTINNAYFEILELQDAREPLERANARLLSIAIFLQVTGLILVLARDLRR